MLFGRMCTSARAWTKEECRTASGFFNISCDVIEDFGAHNVPIVRGLSFQSLYAGEIRCVRAYTS